jgi:hypothetical protein
MALNAWALALAGHVGCNKSRLPVVFEAVSRMIAWIFSAYLVPALVGGAQDPTNGRLLTLSAQAISAWGHAGYNTGPAFYAANSRPSYATCHDAGAQAQLT